MKILFSIVIAIITSFNLSNAESPESPHNLSEKTAPASTDLDISALQEKILSSSLSLFRNDKKIAHGLVVDPRGFVLTKASSSIGARFARSHVGAEYAVRIRKRDENTDLALLEIISSNKLWSPTTWSKDKIRCEEGRWIFTPDTNLEHIFPGIVSGFPRAIQREGGVMGVVLTDKNTSYAQIEIKDIIPHSSADRAGLKIGDLILQVDGNNVSNSTNVYDLIKKKDPGNLMVLQVLRKDRKEDIRVTLGHRSVVFDLFNRNLLMSGPVSKRKDNFSLVLQHDLPMSREMMGSGLFDPWGNCLGLNIARVDRVTNYALLTAEIKKVLNPWLASIP